MAFAFIVIYPSAADTGAGRKLYQQYCVQCHQPEGGDWRNRESRAFMNYVVRTPRRQLAQRIKTGGKVCPAYMVLLSEENIDNVVDYIRVLR